MGDAFGYEVESLRLPEIRRRFGPQGTTERRLQAECDFVTRRAERNGGRSGQCF